MTLPSLAAIGLLLFAYLIGSLSSALILSKVLGFPDPRTTGSNNPGATNVLRIAGKKAAFFTLLGDCLKGLIPVFIALSLSDQRLFIALIGFSAFLGHCYPLFFGFKGGKGVATAIAVQSGLNWLTGAAIIAIWLITAKLLKRSSVAAIIAFSALPLLTYWQEESVTMTLLSAGMSALLIWRHKSNIQRLIKGVEF